MFRGIGNIAALFKQAQGMGARMNELSERLAAERVTGSAAGGMVEVECTGLGQVLRVTIDPGLVSRNERDMIQDLLPAAINDASAKARALHAEAMREITGGLNLPGMEEMLGKLNPQ